MKKILNLSHNMTILKLITFLQKKNPSYTYPTQGSLGQVRPTYFFSKKKKTVGDNKNNFSFSVYSSYKERLNNEN